MRKGCNVGGAGVLAEGDPGRARGEWGDVASLGLRVGSVVYMLMLALTSHG